MSISSLFHPVFDISLSLLSYPSLDGSILYSFLWCLPFLVCALCCSSLRTSFFSLLVSAGVFEMAPDETNRERSGLNDESLDLRGVRREGSTGEGERVTDD
mmetsp:Transcript_46081/g.90830  ORF Transcript_46081/g.90830 Transcript_46081/m.90830 type:complete len:101 (+) Transcript_46081:308-610(+)